MNAEHGQTGPAGILPPLLPPAGHIWQECRSTLGKNDWLNKAIIFSTQFHKNDSGQFGFDREILGLMKLTAVEPSQVPPEPLSNRIVTTPEQVKSI